MRFRLFEYLSKRIDVQDRDSRSVLLHGLRSDSGAFDDSGVAVENLHVVDI